MKSNLTQHPCKGKCTEFKEEQCRHCLIKEPASKPFNLADIMANAIEGYITEFIKGDAVVFTDEARQFDNQIHYVERINTDGSICVHNSISGYSNVNANEIRTATIGEIKAKKRGAEAVALYVRNVV